MRVGFQHEGPAGSHAGPSGGTREAATSSCTFLTYPLIIGRIQNTKKTKIQKKIKYKITKIQNYKNTKIQNIQIQSRVPAVPHTCGLKSSNKNTKNTNMEIHKHTNTKQGPSMPHTRGLKKLNPAIDFYQQISQ